MLFLHKQTNFLKLFTPFQI